MGGLGGRWCILSDVVSSLDGSRREEGNRRKNVYIWYGMAHV
jgi:hypothetical protein